MSDPKSQHATRRNSCQLNAMSRWRWGSWDGGAGWPVKSRRSWDLLSNSEIGSSSKKHCWRWLSVVSTTVMYYGAFQRFWADHEQVSLQKLAMNVLTASLSVKKQNCPPNLCSLLTCDSCTCHWDQRSFVPKSEPRLNSYGKMGIRRYDMRRSGKRWRIEIACDYIGAARERKLNYDSACQGRETDHVGRLIWSGVLKKQDCCDFPRFKLEIRDRTGCLLCRCGPRRRVAGWWKLVEALFVNRISLYWVLCPSSYFYG